MKAMIILMMTTITVMSYTKEELRDLKYLKIEGRAAKVAADSYKGKADKAKLKMDAAELNVENEENRYKQLKAKYSCNVENCLHEKHKKCYKFRTVLKKQEKVVREKSEQLEKMTKDYNTNDKFYKSKLGQYQDCLRKYKEIIERNRK